MFGVRVAAGVALAALVSGCATSRQDVARMQSQMTMLDDRVTQLERSSVGGMAAAPVSGGATEFGSVGSVTVPARTTASTIEKSSAGSSKGTTREIQQALKNAGFYQGAVDGKLGPQTRAAIKEFQRVHGLTDDGVVGRQTWGKLRAYLELSGSGEASLAVK